MTAPSIIAESPVPQQAGARPDRPVNLRDVAREAKVSVATVSMVLNDNPRISRATHLKVQRLVEKMGYQPNRAAQSLASRQTNVLGILLPPVKHAFSDPYFGELLSGISDRAARFGYKIMLEQAKPDFVRERKHLQLFERRYVDGLLCLGVSDKHQHLADFGPRGFAAIAVDNFVPEIPMDCVLCDYAAGAEQLINFLLQLGHRKIAMIQGAPDILTARQVFGVYKQKLNDHGIAFDETLCEFGKYSESGGARAIEKLFKRRPDLTAVFAGNDKMAIGVLHYFKHNSIKVPTQVSVVGFDDLPHSAFVSPSLTTVHLPLYQIGALACERLIDRIRGRSERVDEKLPTHLVVRESTAMAPMLLASARQQYSAG